MGEDSCTAYISSHIFESSAQSCSQVLPCSSGYFEQWMSLSRWCPYWKCRSGPFLGIKLVAVQDSLVGISQASWDLLEGKDSPWTQTPSYHVEIRHTPGSEHEYLPALSSACIFINVCSRSNILKSARRQLCDQHLHRWQLLILFIPFDMLVLSPFLHHRPSP